MDDPVGRAAAAAERSRGELLERQRRLRIATAGAQRAEAHDRRVAYELGRADTLRRRLPLKERPEILAEANGRRVHGHTQPIPAPGSVNTSVGGGAMTRRRY